MAAIGIPITAMSDTLRNNSGARIAEYALVFVVNMKRIFPSIHIIVSCQHLKTNGRIFDWVNKGNPVYNSKGVTSKTHPYDDSWGKWLKKEYRSK